MLEKEIRKRASFNRGAAIFIIFSIFMLVTTIVFLLQGIVVDTSKAEELRKIDLVFLIIYGIGRITAIILSIFIIQILVVLSRYFFRVSDHLNACADAILLFGEDSTKISEYVTALSPKHIDFGKSPECPTDRVLSAIADIVKNLSAYKHPGT